VSLEVGTHAGTHEQRAGRTRLPSRGTGLVLTVVGLPLLTAILLPLQGHLAVGSFLLIYLLAVVVIAVLGGAGPALLAAVASFVLVNWFLTPPYYTLAVASRDTAVDLVVFALVAVLVSVAVEVGARARQSAERHQVESRLLSELGAVEIGDRSVTTVLGRVRELFAMDAVALRHASPGDASVLVSVGGVTGGQPTLRAPAQGGLELVAWGPELVGQDRRLFATLADLSARAWEGQELATRAARAETLAEADRVRAGLLAAVGHDLRTPLAGIKAATSSLRQHDVEWTDAERAALLETIEESADRLTDVISNLLAMSRIQAGALPVDLQPVALDEVVARALLHGATRPVVVVDTADSLPLVLADAGLLEQVVANLIDNASRFTPEGATVEVRADAPNRGSDATRPALARLHVVDHGPGIPPGEWDSVFIPFQRLGDQDTSTGLGLGLAIARGFVEAMSGRLEPSSTPGGGLTMTICLPTAP
jgi:K+-sensing histidine kinase KdpD